ncbi:MAG TPA: response regulator transcription factor [Thermomicrobiales bacterium]|nr:response regulator transcription factor [Thermomicrobiales bacterium]
MTDRQTTVLVVDDEHDIVQLMRDFLEADGYAVVTAMDASEALQVVRRTPLDCVLLDLMLPGQSGFEVLRRIRATSDVPVLFLSAREEDSDKIRGLGLGADDYVVKSATPAEVVARVRAVLRRYRRGEPAAPALLEFGRVTIDLRARQVRVNGDLVPFTAREFDLLQMFAQHPCQVLTREQIFERLWGPYGDRHTLTVHIGRLRDKIEEDPANPRYITTVWGVGYRFEGAPRR